MLKKIINILFGKDHTEDNLIKTRDKHGNYITIEDRRSHEREPFRDRPTLEQQTYTLLCGFIHSAIGLSLEPDDRQILEGRLMNRIRALDMATFEEYLGYMCSRRGIDAELDHLIDCVTTSKTYFYRQPEHFEFIFKTAVPELLKKKRDIRAWSVGCASGEEAYTTAMMLAKSISGHGPFNYSVLATDISPLALKRAEQGQYDTAKVNNLPDKLMNAYMINTGDTCMVSQEIKQHVTFKRLNLLDDNYGIDEQVDIALYRNVGIYFDAGEQQRVLQRICDNLAPGGYLLLGHTENVDCFDCLSPHRKDDSVYIKKEINPTD